MDADNNTDRADDSAPADAPAHVPTLTADYSVPIDTAPIDTPTDLSNITSVRNYHIHYILALEHNRQLQSQINYICKKYDIVKCHTCHKFRNEYYKCGCGLTFCKKCDLRRGRDARIVACHKCDTDICSNCSADLCGECGKYICRGQYCRAFICEGSRFGDCTVVMCCGTPCRVCNGLWCKKCIVGHAGCEPKLCSCGALVYKTQYQTQSILGTSIEDLPAQYQIQYCPICRLSSCLSCEAAGRRHRANHSIIPFLIINRRDELPCYLPQEIIYLIWLQLLCD